MVKDVQKNVAKVAMINPNPQPVNIARVDAPVKDPHDLQGATSMQDALLDAGHQTAANGAASASREQTDAEQFPEIAAPAKREGDALDEDDLDQDFDVHGFDHPSTYTSQPWIWIPKDGLGLSGLFVRELRAAGVDASDDGAVMDDKGLVEVNRGPPDEDWAGGRDA